MRKYTLIDNQDDLEELLAVLDENPVAAIDFEGWTIVRLAQVCNDDTWFVVDFGPDGDNWFHEVAHWFEDYDWIAFNSGHEKREFAKHGDVYPTVWDAGHLRRALEGGGHMSLKQLVGWELDIEMDKTEQASNWDVGELTQSQLDYAANDALWTWQAWCKMKARATPGHMRCFNLLDGMTDAVIEMEETGLLLDRAHHRELIADWQALNDEREKHIRELITEEEVENLNSGKQLNDFFAKLLPDNLLSIWPRTEKTGALSTANKDLINMAGAVGGDNPLGRTLTLLAERSTLQKYLSSFGDTLITKSQMAKDGRVRARYNIGAAITCRFSSSGPNLQQIPRDRDFFGQRLSIRKGFVAAPGRKLISFDYSGIEMRVLALVSGDDQLLEDAVYGDVHTEAASLAAGRRIDPKASVEDKELRQGAKAVNFGIVYGTTALGLAGRQGWSFDFADNFIQQWAGRYPKAFGLRHEMQAEAKATGYLPMTDGGTIYVGKKAGLTICANYPVQRAALSVMARAIIRHKASMEELRERYPSNFIAMCSTIHDALIDEADDDLAALVMKTMKTDMELGFLDVFPGHSIERLVEGGLGPSWGELEEVDV